MTLCVTLRMPFASLCAKQLPPRLRLSLSPPLPAAASRHGLLQLLPFDELRTALQLLPFDELRASLLLQLLPFDELRAALQLQLVRLLPPPPATASRHCLPPLPPATKSHRPSLPTNVCLQVFDMVARLRRSGAFCCVVLYLLL